MDYFEEKIKEFENICFKLGFIKENGEADTKACLDFLIEFDKNNN